MMKMKKIFVVSLLTVFAVGTAKADIASTAYVNESLTNSIKVTSTGTGPVVTNVTNTDGKISVTKGKVQIPVGSETATTYATIWVE